MEIKALACELPSRCDRPFSRWSISDLAHEACRVGLVAAISHTTVWRWLNEDAIRPWKHRSWIFPRDPQFAEKAGNILDLYQRMWQGKELTENDFVISTDEKTSIQARQRLHPTLPCEPYKPIRVEHEYERLGAWAYLAALDVHRTKIFGHLETKTGIVPFDRLVNSVMSQSPYKDAQRVFWIMDNGSAHRGASCVERLTSQFPNIVVVHGPIHASWLNQIEIFFSILQRKALMPNDFQTMDELSHRIIGFQSFYESIAKPFEWKFTRKDLKRLLKKMTYHTNKFKVAA
jgi:hypothetical protein